MAYQTQFERYELKYLIDEVIAGEIRRHVEPYVSADRNNPPLGQGGYDIYTLYLDSPTYALHRAKMRDAPDRYKLRIRTYDTECPANFEIKRKVKDVISKSRAAVRREDVADAVAGFAGPISDTPEQRKTVDTFARCAAQLGAEPRLVVLYTREAYVSDVDGYARLTFDRHLRCQRVDGYDLNGVHDEWIEYDGYWESDGPQSPVILELKCESRVPYWMGDVIRSFDLRLVGFSKYSIGLKMSMNYDMGRGAPSEKSVLNV